MKSYKIVSKLMLLIVFFISGPSLLNAQSVQEKSWTQDFSLWVPCANDGLGEQVVGTVDLHLVFHYKDGVQTKIVAHAPGGILVGQTTGTLFHTTGVTLFLVDNNPDKGAFTDTFVNRFNVVGKGGVRFWIFDTIHVTVNANGETTANILKTTTSCK